MSRRKIKSLFCLSVIVLYAGFISTANPINSIEIKEIIKINQEELDLSYKGLNSIPEEVFEIKQLKILKLNANQITYIPSKI